MRVISYSLLILTLFSSCGKSRINLNIYDFLKYEKTNSLSIQKIEISPIDNTKTIQVHAKYSGDDNDNSSVNFYFCSIKNTPGCDPLTGEKIVLQKNGTIFEGNINLLTSTISRGDFLKYQLISTDIDGLNGGNESGSVFIPYDNSMARSIRQLSSFSFQLKPIDTGGSEKAFALVKGADGSIYLGGYTTSNLAEFAGGGKDILIIKLNPLGELDTRFAKSGYFHLGGISSQYTQNEDQIFGLVFDNEGNLYASGTTTGSLGGPNGGSSDVFIMKINSLSGTLDTSFGNGDGRDNDGILQINNINSNDASGLEMLNSRLIFDGNSSLFLGGSTVGNLGGANAGNFDAYIIKVSTLTGSLDENFGDGDGNDNDGILQINNLNTSSTATGQEMNSSIVYDGTGNIYLAGSVFGGNLGGPSAGASDCYIAKVNSVSGLLDSQFGDSDGVDNDGILRINHINSVDPNTWDNINDIAIDIDGNIFAVGETKGGNLGGLNSHPPFSNIIVLKLESTNGNLDSSFGDGDGINDDGVVQFNDSNTELWDIPYKVIITDNSILIAGNTSSALFGGVDSGGGDAFVLKLDKINGLLDSDFGDGDGTDNDGIVRFNNINSNDAIYADIFTNMLINSSNEIFAVGYTKSLLGGLNAGSEDIFIAKLDFVDGLLKNDFGSGDGINNDGIIQFNSTKSTNAYFSDNVTSVFVDDNGKMFIAGHTNSSLGGKNSGGRDAFIAKLNSISGVLDPNFGSGDGQDNDGILQFNSFLVSDALGDDSIFSIAQDDSGKIYAVGETRSSFGGANAGASDVFILKIDSNTGSLDTSFGNGDGSDNDGIVQFNNFNVNDASMPETSYDLEINSNGDLLVTGSTYSSLGGTNAGSSDIFTAKVDSTSGNFITSFGNGDGHNNDGILQFNNINTNNASSTETAFKTVIDQSGNLYISGRTMSALGGTNGGGFDGVLIKVNSITGVLDTSFGNGDGHNNDGILQFNNSISNSSAHETFTSIALDGIGNLYGVGYTNGDFGGTNSGLTEGYIFKFNLATGQLDTSFGNGDGADNDGIFQINNLNALDSSSYEYFTDLSIDNLGYIYVVGNTESSLGGSISSAYEDAIIIKLDSFGIINDSFGNGDGNDNDGILQINTSNTLSANNIDLLNSIYIDSEGNLFAVGDTRSSLSEKSAGEYDIFSIMIKSGSNGITP